MEFLNKRIQSEKYGVGTVISIDDSVFTVEFENETKSFNYMIAFENKALSFIDENDQKELDELFAEKEAERLAAEKKAAEIKEQREREEAQKQEIKDRLSFAVDESLSGDSVKLIGDFEFNDEDLDYLTIHFINQYKYFNESVSKLNEADVKAFLVVMINKLRDYDKPWSEFHELLSSFFDHISLFDTQSKITNLYNKVEKIFETNLIDFSEVTIDCLSPARARMVCDGNYDTGVCLDKGQVIAWKWQEAVTFSIFLAQEDIRKGQRVESFSLEYKTEEGTWATAAEGSTIGYKRLLHFEPVTTTEARMVIHSSRLEPFIAETGLY